MVFFLSIVLTLLLDFTEEANILFLNTWNSKSHGLTMKYLAERLATRGHNVSLYSMVHTSVGPMATGVHNLETALPYGAYTDDQNITAKIFWSEEMAPEIFELPHKIGVQYLNYSLKDEIFRSMVQTSFELIILDEMFATGQSAIAFYLQKKFGSKIAIFSTTDLFPLYSMYRGLSRNIVTYPNYYTKGYNMFDYNPQDFWLRLMAVRDAFVEQVSIRILSDQWMLAAGKLLDVDVSFSKLYESSFVSFMDYPSRYGYSVPRSVDLVYIGEHCKKSRSLPDDFASFIEDPKSKGTIYIAFGSIVHWASGPPQVVSTFVTVLNQLTSFRIIWVYAGPMLSNLGPHIKISRWAPQNDILMHKKTILFFTHGGIKSLKEGLCSETPMLFLPFFADQPKNALYALNHGIADAIYKQNITVDELTAKLTNVLYNSKYHKKVKKFNQHFLDHVIAPLDLGVFWAEKVMKLSGDQTMYYKIRGRHLWWYQYGYIDFIIYVLIILAVTYN